LFQNPISPWGARGWSQFCFAKLLLAHAAWIAAEIPQAWGISQKSPAEELERKARFFAKQKMRTLVLGKAPLFRLFRR
jgi:hypothetical protein